MLDVFYDDGNAGGRAELRQRAMASKCSAASSVCIMKSLLVKKININFDININVDFQNMRFTCHPQTYTLTKT